jgi:hypothetical protein
MDSKAIECEGVYWVCWFRIGLSFILNGLHREQKLLRIHSFINLRSVDPYKVRVTLRT